jgi:hypothetical protein
MVRRHIDAVALPRLREQVSHFEPEQLPQLHGEAESASRACRTSNETGLGLLQDGQRLIRGSLGGDEPLKVLTVSGACIEIRNTQLVIRLDPSSARGHKSPRRREFVVTGWRNTPTGTSVMTRSGPIELGHGHAAELLRMLAPSAEAVRVRPVPVMRMFAYLIVGLQDITSLADHAAQSLLVYHNPSPIDVAQRGGHSHQSA